MFTLGFEKISGRFSEAANKAAKKAGLSAHDTKRFRDHLAENLRGARNEARKWGYKYGWTPGSLGGKGIGSVERVGTARGKKFPVARVHGSSGMPRKGIYKGRITAQKVE